MVDKPVSVLVIDDEPAVLEAMKLALQRSGFEVLAAQSVAHAVADLSEIEKIPDVIIADYQLQNSELGIVAIRLVQKAVGVHVPGIIITGDTSPQITRQAEASGVRLLHKPVRAEKIKSVITSVLESGH